MDWKGEGWKETRHAKHNPWQNKQYIHFSSINNIFKKFVGFLGKKKKKVPEGLSCLLCSEKGGNSTERHQRKGKKEWDSVVQL